MKEKFVVINFLLKIPMLLLLVCMKIIKKQFEIQLRRNKYNKKFIFNQSMRNWKLQALIHELQNLEEAMKKSKEVDNKSIPFDAAAEIPVNKRKKIKSINFDYLIGKYSNSNTSYY